MLWENEVKQLWPFLNALCCCEYTAQKQGQINNGKKDKIKSEIEWTASDQLIRENERRPRINNRLLIHINVTSPKSEPKDPELLESKPL